MPVKKSGKTTHGNKQVKAILTESAWGASRTKGTFLSSKYRKLVGKRGKKRAIVAVAHAILVIAYHLIKEKKNFVELGAGYVDSKRRNAQLNYYRKRIEELGAEIPDNKSA